ncbi:pentatricopeptide repeat-containing protein [Fagus crenata]
MATLQNALLPSKPIPDILFSHRLNVFHHQTPAFKSRAPTATFNGSNTKTDSNQRYPQAHLNSIANRTTNHVNSSSEINDTDIAQCLSLLNTNCLSDCRQVHAHAVKLNAFESNRLIGNKLTILYSKNNESLKIARKVFDEIPERTVPGYVALIRAFCRLEQWDDLFSVFGSMVDDGLLPNKYLVPTILKACSAMQILRSGKMIHGYVIRKELDLDIFVGNALIDLYANFADLRLSRSVFDTMKERDVVSWTALVSAYMVEGHLDEAMEIFHSMQSNGVKPDLISWNALVSGFARNGEIALALLSLEEMQERGLKPRVNSWNGIISGCVQSGYFEDALDAFSNMVCFPVDPNFVTIASILPACAGLKDLNLGRAVHGYALKRELCGNVHVDGSLIDMYAKCGRTDSAVKLFVKVDNKNTAMWNEMIAAYVNESKMEEALKILRLMKNNGFRPDVITCNTLLAGHARNGQMKEAYDLLSEIVLMGLEPDIVSFNVLISGFQQSGLSYEALKLFWNMQSNGYFLNQVLILSNRPNAVTTTGALAACADLNLLPQGKEIHGYALRNGFESNIFVSSALIDMYVKCHNMDLATQVFRRLENRNTICWNVLIAGHVSNAQLEEALELFNEMLLEGLQPSSITFLTLLPACGDKGTLRVGRELHGYIIKNQFDFDDSNSTLASALIGMYAKCGSILEAKSVFDSGAVEDFALWNSMISVYLTHGMDKDAIALFEKMELMGIAPDHSFTELLSACARDGVVE